jgi:hypothetical protein
MGTYYTFTSSPAQPLVITVPEKGTYYTFTSSLSERRRA